MGVPLGHAGIGVPESFGDVLDGYAPLPEPGRRRVSEIVFVPDEPLTGDRPIRGHAERKPEAEWNWEMERLQLKSVATAERFRKLDMAEVRRLEVHLMTPCRFERLPDGAQPIVVRCDDVDVALTLTRDDTVPVSVDFEFGGYTIPHNRTVVRLELNGREPFLVAALEKALKPLREDTDGRRLFTSHYLTRECLLFALRATNRLIDCYRVAFDDPWERPIGLADVLSGATIIELQDGERQTFQSGISLRHMMRTDPRDGEDREAMERKMRELAARGVPPFDSTALIELRSALLCGQYRQCVVWAGMIMANVIEDILLLRLPKDSEEYRRLKNQSSDVSGRTKRGSYFKKATGRTLEEWLVGIERSHPIARGFAQNVADVLNNRNLLLHRRKAIRAEEAELAVNTCFEFLTALFRGVPFGPNDAEHAHI